ncbi:MAG: DUF2459 domain-containing protein [Elainella sp. Prado103]|jgi:uncharacterized protein (TIGR02117 family)|nr:DUF2459 domain-containing protein [Elainella sp. Prado103]
MYLFKQFRSPARLIVSFLLLSLTLPLLAVILPGSSALTAWLRADHPSCQYRVCVLQYGYHSKLLVPVQVGAFDWRDHLEPPAVFQTGTAQPAYISFGRGAKDWYIQPPQTARERFLRMFPTLLLPNQPILRVQWHDQLPIDRKLKCVGVNATDYFRLIAYLQAGFQTDAMGKKIQIAEDVGDRSQFYLTPGTYSLMNNSNHWTAGGLKTAKLPTPLWPVHAAPVVFYLDGTPCNTS